MKTESELFEIFEKVDNELCSILRAKSHNAIWTLHGCDRDSKYNAPVFADDLIGFYTIVEIDFIKEMVIDGVKFAIPSYMLGASCYDIDILTDEESEHILKLFANKYRI